MPEKMKRPKKQEIYAPADVKIPSRLGGGVLKERVIRDLPSKKVASYALAYINPLIFSGDNGRVPLHGTVLVCLEMIVLSVASTAPQKTVKSMKRINELHRAIGKSGGKRS